MSSPQARHVWPNQIAQWLSPRSNISSPQAGFQRGGLDMFRFLAPQQLFLVVQEKLDCPVLKIGLSGFRGLKPRTDLTPSRFFSLLSLSYTQEQPWGRPQDPLWLFHGSSMESWSSWVKSTPKNWCLYSPNWFSPILRYFHLILDLFTSWMDLRFLWCIVFIHVIDQSPAISLSFLG
jgi:hypothetical protein